MFVKIANHIRLTLKLLFDGRVSLLTKVFFFALPLVYAVKPFFLEISDFLPVIGLLDDFLLLGVASLVFVFACPSAVVKEHRSKMKGTTVEDRFNMEACRHPDEIRNLGFAFFIVILALVITGMSVGYIMLLLLAIGYIVTRIRRAHMLSSAVKCTPVQFPELHTLLQAAQAELPDVEVNMFVSQNPVMNAYTFGLQAPYTIVLTSALVDKLEQDEIQAVIGHELGHVLFDHVVLINLLSVSITGLERLPFKMWSRSGEYTADAVALKASRNDPRPMISGLLKMASGVSKLNVDMDAFLTQVRDGEEKGMAKTAEFLSTHPAINNRIRRLLEISQRPDPKPQAVEALATV